jgi:xylose dehydrogenase (NAD/NADP)
MANGKIRWGILGCARITRRGLIPGIRESQTGVLEALASRTAGTAQAWAAEFSVPRVYSSYEELLSDSEIDAVYIPLPNELHKPWVLAAADAGKHVLCEKPLALDAAEARAMVDHCRARSVVLLEAFMWRHQPRTLELLDRVERGDIGELRLVRVSFSFPITPDDWRLDPARGGGALWDVGCYGVSTARLFAGTEPVGVRSFAHFSPEGVDLTLTTQLQFPNDVIGSIDCSFEQPFRCVYELVGTRGSIEVPDAYVPPTGIKPRARWQSIGAAPDSGAEPDRIEVLEFEASNQYGDLVDAFGASVAAGRLVAPAEDGLAQMIVLDQILSAARDSR